MFQKFKSLALERQMFLSFSCASALLLIATLFVALYFDIDRQHQSIDASIATTAAYAASLDEVSEMLERGYPSGKAAAQLDKLHHSLSSLDTIAVYSRDGLRFYHTSRNESGDTFVSGEETAILSGAAPYITSGYSTQGSQRKAFHAVTNGEGEIIGFVTVAIFLSDIMQRNLALLPAFFCILAAALVIALLLSRGIVRLLQSSLHGYQPDELLDLYIRQDEVLNAIEDGLIATDGRGVVLFSNKQARRLFQQQEDVPLQGRNILEFFPESSCTQVAQSGVPIHNHSQVINGHSVLATVLPVRANSGQPGVLSVFHDKTEMRKLSDQLSGAREMLDTLRFFNHEFMNKLHVILGYLQTNQIQEATQFIINSSLVSSQSIRETADCIRIPRLCALIIGKMMHASELGILLTVSHDSSCREEDLLVPVEDWAAIIGNLLENAIEELSRSQPEIREIQLSLYCRPDCNLIICEDTGSGIPADLLPHIWEKGVSSKGDDRGLGLNLVGQLIEKNHGSIQIDTEPGEGTVFTLTFTREGEMH